MKASVLSRRAALLIALLIALLPVFAFADVPSPGADFYYLDEAGVMSEETKSMLYTNGEALKKACGAQIVVLTVKSFNGMSADDYAYNVINKWGVGDEEKSNGVVLAIDEVGGEYRMTIGSGLERYWNSAKVQRMLDEYFHPLFKEYKTDLAIRNLYAKLFEEIKTIYKLNLTLVSGEDLPGQIMVYVEDEPTEEKKGISFGTIFIIIVILLVVLYIVKNARTKKFQNTPSDPLRPDDPQPSVNNPVGTPSGKRPIIVVRPSIFGNRHHSRGGFGGFGGFSSSSRSSGSSSRSSSSRSSGSFRSSGFGGARGGGGGGRGIGGGGRR